MFEMVLNTLLLQMKVFEKFFCQIQGRIVFIMYFLLGSYTPEIDLRHRKIRRFEIDLTFLNLVGLMRQSHKMV